MRKKPKWLQKVQGDIQESTRERSSRQEKKIADGLRGKRTLNSGATFGQNDVLTDAMEIEAKITRHRSYSLTLKDWEKLRLKTHPEKMPVMVIEFEGNNKELAVISYEDLKYLLWMEQ